MTRRVIKALVSAAVAACAASTMSILGAAPIAAHAATPMRPAVQVTVGIPPAKPKPAPAAPTSVQITGKGLTQPLVIHSQEDADKLKSVLSQVNWLADANPTADPPEQNRRGPKYRIVVFAKNAPQQTYDLYPLAAGGPRAYRPAKQPTGKTDAGWFYAALTMSETLRLCGVPLPEKPDVLSGGIGGGELISSTSEVTRHGPGLNDFLAQLRALLLLNGAIALIITVGLAGTTYLIRHRS